MTCVKTDKRAKSGLRTRIWTEDYMVWAAPPLSPTSHVQAASLGQRRLGHGISTEKHARI